MFIDLKTITDGRGKLIVMEKLPFDIKRVYYLRDIKKNQTRGGHAHRETKRLMVAVNGSFKVNITQNDSSDLTLDDPQTGLFIDSMTWVELSEFSEGAVCLVLASTEHDELDCIREFDEFVVMRHDDEARRAVVEQGI